MPPNEVLFRLTEQASINIGIFFTVRADGVIILKENMIRKHGHCIKSLKETVNGVQITLHDGQNALIKLGQHYAQFADRIIHEGEVAIKGYMDVSPDEWDQDKE